MTTFHAVAPADTIAPGSVKRVKIEAYEIGVYNIEGEFFAIDDICTHMRARLSNGYVDGEIVECPVHFGKFNVKTGAASGAPCTEDINTYPIKVDNGEVYVGLD
jgi:naphthalene 1,2-dioxygenase system ferredoxin subunit